MDSEYNLILKTRIKDSAYAIKGDHFVYETISSQRKDCNVDDVYSYTCIIGQLYIEEQHYNVILEIRFLKYKGFEICFYEPISRFFDEKLLFYWLKDNFPEQVHPVWGNQFHLATQYIDSLS